MLKNIELIYFRGKVSVIIKIKKEGKVSVVLFMISIIIMRKRILMINFYYECI